MTDTSQQPPVPEPVPRPPRVWGFWTTLAWGFAAYVAFTIAQSLAIIAIVLSTGATFDRNHAMDLLGNGVNLAIMTLAAVPAVLAVLWLATRAARQPFAEYLAVRGFSFKHLILGVVLIAIYLPGSDLISKLTGHAVTPPIVVYNYTSARDAGALWLILFAFCFAGPVTEEFAIRGFLFRGFAATRLGGWGAMVLTAALWAIMHAQYDWYYLGQIFGAGLVLAFMRWQSGSTWLTVVLHGMHNLYALVQAAIIDRMSS